MQNVMMMYDYVALIMNTICNKNRMIQDMECHLMPNIRYFCQKFSQLVSDVANGVSMLLYAMLSRSIFIMHA